MFTFLLLLLVLVPGHYVLFPDLHNMLQGKSKTRVRLRL